MPPPFSLDGAPLLPACAPSGIGVLRRSAGGGRDQGAVAVRTATSRSSRRVFPDDLRAELPGQLREPLGILEKCRLALLHHSVEEPLHAGG